MRLRIALAAMAVALVAAPLSATSNASTCNVRDFPEVCEVVMRVCQTTTVAHKVCGLFA